MPFATTEDLKQEGFQGFSSIAQLRASECKEVPEVPGVYCVVRDSTRPPSFLPTSPGGHFKGRDPTVPISTLESSWVPGTVVVYIGQSGGGRSSETLRDRLGDLMRFGSGVAIGHTGGRYIWQLSDHEHLRVCWRPSATTDARDEKRGLLQAFDASYGVLPFANLTQ